MVLTFEGLVVAVVGGVIVVGICWMYALCRASAMADRDMTAIEARRQIFQRAQAESAARVKCGRFPKDAA